MHHYSSLITSVFLVQVPESSREGREMLAGWRSQEDAKRSKQTNTERVHLQPQSLKHPRRRLPAPVSRRRGGETWGQDWKLPGAHGPQHLDLPLTAVLFHFRSRKIQIRNIPPQLRWEVSVPGPE